MNDTITKPTYALLRVDVVVPSSGSRTKSTTIQLRASSESFGYLDPKDALYREVAAAQAQPCMPNTHLIAWDTESEVSQSVFPSCPALLKAALGSGGFGLYFVYTPRDIQEVVLAHRRRAEGVPGFLDGLRRDYGTVPDWSLQQLVPSVRMRSMDGRRCQLRAYVVECNGLLYLYDTYEARVPWWNIDLDQVLQDELALSRQTSSGPPVGNDAVAPPAAPRWSAEVENECCGAGNARPYNEQRNKGRTERYLIEEVPELNHSAVRAAIHNCVRSCMQAIKPGVLQRSKGAVTSTPSSSGSEIAPSTLAIAGVDLLISGDCAAGFTAVIVEINNNPAMPAPHKHMSPLYRAHLVDMAANIMKLGVSAAGRSGENNGIGALDDEVRAVLTNMRVAEAVSRFELL